MLKWHGIRVRRLDGDAALAFYIRSSVIVLHRLFEFAGLGRIFIDRPHRPVRGLVRRFCADGLAGGLHDALRRLMRKNRLFLQTLTFAHRNRSSKVSTSRKTIYADFALENAGMISLP